MCGFHGFEIKHDFYMFQLLKHSFQFGLDLLQVAVRQKRNYAVDFLDAPVPPFEVEQQVDQLVVETLPKHLGWIADYNRIRRDIASENAVCADDCAIPDMHAWQDDCVLPNPDIVPYDGVALERKLFFGWLLHPPALQSEERIGCHGIHLVISAVHDKLNACSNLAELADNQLVTKPLVMMRDVAFKLGIGDVGEIADNNIWIPNGRLDVDFPVVARYRMDFIRVWLLHVCSMLLSLRHLPLSTANPR